MNEAEKNNSEEAEISFLYYTLDLETMGVRPTSAIMAIGAVAFNLEDENTVSFYQNVDLENCLDLGLTVDANTIYWWLTQSNLAASAMMSEREDLELVLTNLYLWVKKFASRAKCWTHATFDAPILSNAYAVCKLPQPTHFTKQRDLRTLTQLKGEVRVLREGEHHNALDDALYQAKYIRKQLNL